MNTLSYFEHIDPSDNVTVYNQYCGAGSSKMPMHSHEFIEIVYCFEGSGIQIINDQEHPFNRGTLLFLNHGQSHSFYSDSGMRYYDFIFTPSFLSESLIHSVDALSLLSLTVFSDIRISEFLPIIHLSGTNMMEVEYIAKKMSREFAERKPGFRAVISGYMTVLFSLMFRVMILPTENDVTSLQHFKMNDVMLYIEEHLNEKISVSELAKRSFYNPSYFGRLFREYSGMSLNDFIHQKRITKASELLHETDISVENIATTVGYNDLKLFYRQFKEQMGTTPGLFRKRKNI